MKKPLLPLGAACLLALFVTGCETDDIATRVREKSAIYAALPPAQKKKIDQGIIALGFTADMVYMAMGHPSKVEPVKGSGGRTELWTYRNYYPVVDAAHMRYSDYRTESPYQPSQFYAGTNTPVGTNRSRSAAAYTGGPQGSTPEPADLPIFTLRVLMQDGKVKRLGIAPG